MAGRREQAKEEIVQLPDVGRRGVGLGPELSRGIVEFSRIADTPVEPSTRLREANDSWIAIKRRLKGGGFVRVERDGGAR